MLRGVLLEQPEDLAGLVSYTRKAPIDLEAKGPEEMLALERARSALEQALGLHFEEMRGERFLCSSLVLTLFRGVFSAWCSGAGTNGLRRRGKFH